LSERYVQELLEGAGFSFSGYVRELRLDRAYKMLRDRRYAALRISDIAMQAGFSDLSYFNRSFRVRYGLTPNEARRS
jgi:AraC-like DNA-binding protein